jgi:hypothetical protein
MLIGLPAVNTVRDALSSPRLGIEREAGDSGSGITESPRLTIHARLPTRVGTLSHSTHDVFHGAKSNVTATTNPV